MRLLNVLFVCLCSVTTSIAQNTYAVVVGVSDYKYGTKNDLKFADSDATNFAKFLKSKNGGYVPATNIILLTNAKADRNSILVALRLLEKARPQDKVYFYFSGHGNDGVFVPYDENLLTHKEVKSAFKSSKAKTKIIIADACLSGSMKVDTKKEKEGSTLLNRAFKDFKNASNTVVILSSRPYQNSKESGRLQAGAFTFHFLKAMYGAADTNKDKKITVKETFDYISPMIRKETSNLQAPIIYGKFDNNMVLSRL